ncbi:MAG: hypothetical protein JWQ09_941 [Segetibacter sp.]|nr:hypothetical protein [Segetibacter sp.]
MLLLSLTITILMYSLIKFIRWTDRNWNQYNQESYLYIGGIRITKEIYHDFIKARKEWKAK